MGESALPTAFQLDMDFNQLKYWISHVSQAIMVVNDRGMVVAVNHPFHRLIKYSFEEMEDQAYFHFLHLSTPFQLIQKKQGWTKGELRSKTGARISTDVQIINKVNGGETFYLFTFYPRSPHQGIFCHLCHHSPVGMMTLCKKHGIVLEINTAACSALGVERGTALYQPIYPLLPDFSEREQLVSFLTRPWKFGHQLELEWNEQFILLTANQPDEETKDWLGYQFFIENQTKMRVLEQQLKYNNRLATIGQIAAGSAHEIRNPLTSIKGFLQVISGKLEASGHQKEQSYISLMLKEINRINHLVGELLLLSKPKEMDMCSVQISQVMKEILPIIKNEALLHNIRIHIDDQTSANVEILADGKLLKQVFLNLCKNAIESMGEDGCLTIRLMKQKKKKLVVEFHDTGLGIPRSVRDKIFEPFFTTKENGTGLGLPICKQIMKEIGGKISVASTKKGSVFRVQLPLA